MNENTVIVGLVLYTLFIFIVAVTDTYHLFIEQKVQDKIMNTRNVSIHNENAPTFILHENSKKDYRLNMKRRPPIIWVAH